MKPTRAPLPAITDVSDAIFESVTSQRSVDVFHCTLFEDFGLRAEANYNFYVEDETSNTVQDENVHPSELPRYIELFWRACPIKNVQLDVRKGTIVPPRANPLPTLDVSIAKTAIANGFISPGHIRASIVPATTAKVQRFDEDAFLLDPKSAGKSATVAKSQKTFVKPSAVQSQRTMVSFADPSVDGVVTDSRLGVAEDELHLGATAAIAKLLPSLEVISEFNQDVPTRNPVPRFPTVGDLPTLFYVGYVIERYGIGDDGSMVLERTIDVPDIEQSRVVDRQVLFGKKYAYRIRAIVQWTRPPSTDFFGEVSGDVGTNARQGRVASFYGGDWSDWSKSQIVDDVLPLPPDEIYVRPVSRKGLIDIVWKMPADSQRDLSGIRLLRCVQTGDSLSQWKLIYEGPPTNGRFVDTSVLPFEQSGCRYVYALYSQTVHGEISALSQQIEARVAAPSTNVEEYDLIQVAPAGGDPMGASHLHRPTPVETVVSFEKTASITLRNTRSSLPLQKRQYIVRVRSLTTGESVDVSLDADAVSPPRKQTARGINT